MGRRKLKIGAFDCFLPDIMRSSWRPPLLKHNLDRCDHRSPSRSLMASLSSPSANDNQPNFEPPIGSGDLVAGFLGALSLIDTCD